MEHQELLHQINQGCLTQGLRLLPLRFDSLRARAMILKIGLQESKLRERRQLIRKGGFLVPQGPAVSLWQFERSGIGGVLRHAATAEHARTICRLRNVPATRDGVWEHMQKDDLLGASFARLNLFWHSAPLPELDDCWGSWAYYEHCWNPGKPKPETWEEYHNAVLAYLRDQA